MNKNKGDTKPMKKTLILAAAVAACVPCLDWTRLSGTVRDVNRTESTITIQNKDGDLLIIPYDHQVAITEKHGENRNLTSLRLNDKITLIRTKAPKPVEDTEGMAQPEPPYRGK